MHGKTGSHSMVWRLVNSLSEDPNMVDSRALESLLGVRPAEKGPSMLFPLNSVLSFKSSHGSH